MAERSLLVAGLLAAGCAGGAQDAATPLGSPGGACSLGAAQPVARAAGHDFDAVAMVALQRGAIALYSDASGTYARTLGVDGGPLAAAATPAVRIGERCAGGLSAVWRGAGADVACLRPGDGAWLLRLEAPDSLKPGPSRRIGPSGDRSRGIVVREHGRGVAVAYHDADADAHRVWLALDGPQGPKPPVQLGPRDAVVEAPELLSVGAQLYAAYVTWELDPDASRSTLHVEAVGGQAHARMPLLHHEPSARLSALGDELLLSYRDRPSPRARLEHFTQRLSPELVAQGEKLRVGRANGSGGPTLTRCGDTVFSAAPIDHGSELYVIFHALDPALTARDPNHQCYATARSFVTAADACSGGDLLALVAEETDPSGAPAELLAMRFSCAR